MSLELHGLSERWFQAWLEKDATTVERLAAEDYVYVAPNGLDPRSSGHSGNHPFSELSAGSRHAHRSRCPRGGHDAAVVRHQGAGTF